MSSQAGVASLDAAVQAALVEAIAAACSMQPADPVTFVGQHLINAARVMQEVVTFVRLYMLYSNFLLTHSERAATPYCTKGSTPSSQPQCFTRCAKLSLTPCG
jgi:hypothetical protein